MLEIRELTKIYHAKEGTSVRALDNISMSLPSTGMVFILGKSGSGKSTLLNVIGGLDGCDGGEFIINGKSSKDFSAADFDAYRNTYVGFIFQEYNMLEDFSVAENVALALELQGKAANLAEIESVLTSLELQGFGDRRINELSGGQKQRVAIARALIKKPEILMADEPTGALDSETGEALFKTLKELSKEKLVLVVSHDRDFAERYGDRIIELQDGRIIADTAQQPAVSKEPQKPREAVRDEPQESPAQKPAMIRSRLSAKKAFRMGAGGLRHKMVRLIASILLSFIAFTMFGLSDTMAAYQKINAATQSILDSNVRAAVVDLVANQANVDKDGNFKSYPGSDGVGISEEDIAWLKSETGLDFVPVANNFSNASFFGSSAAVIPTACGHHFKDRQKSEEYYTGNLYGFAPMDEAALASYGFTLTGRLPQTDDEIVIPEFLYRQFVRYGFQNKTAREFVNGDALQLAEGENGILGKHLGLSLGARQRQYRIVGVLDTGFEYERYAALLPGGTGGGALGEDGLTYPILARELKSELHYGFHTLGILTAGEIERAVKLSSNTINGQGYTSSGVMTVFMDGKYLASIGASMTSDILPEVEVRWLDGVARNELGENEFLLSLDAINKYYLDYLEAVLDLTPVHQRALALYGDCYDADDAAHTLYDNIVTAALAKYEQDHGAKPADEDAYIKAEVAKFAATVGEWLRLDIPEVYAHLIVPPLLRGFSNGVVVTAEELYLLRVQAYATALVCVDNLQEDEDYVAMVSQYAADGTWTGTVLEQKQQKLAAQFVDYLNRNSFNPFGELTGGQILRQTGDMMLEMTGGSLQELLGDAYVTTGNADGAHKEWKLVGFFDPAQTYYLSAIGDCVIEEMHRQAEIDWGVHFIPLHRDGAYAYAVAPMPKDEATVRKLVEATYNEDLGITFRLSNQVISTLAAYNEYIEDFAIAFVYIGAGFALFAVLLLANFIATSVAYKKRDIGVLRALGAGRLDVIKIFSAEAMIIGLINFALAAVTTGICTAVINGAIRAEGLKVTLLTFGPRQFLLLLSVSLFVTLAASFLPVWRIARKKPVDAIKDR